MDYNLFNCSTSDEHHVLHQLLPVHLSVLTVDTHSDHKDTTQKNQDAISYKMY